MDAFTSTFGYRISNMTEATSAATPPISAGALPAVRAVLVDDEKLARANLRHALSEVPGWQVVAECSSAAAAPAVPAPITPTSRRRLIAAETTPDPPAPATARPVI